MFIAGINCYQKFPTASVLTIYLHSYVSKTFHLHGGGILFLFLNKQFKIFEPAHEIMVLIT